MSAAESKAQSADSAERSRRMQQCSESCSDDIPDCMCERYQQDTSLQLHFADRKARAAISEVRLFASSRFCVMCKASRDA